MSNQVVTVGRRKSAVARVFLTHGGTGKMVINDRSLNTYFPQDLLQMKVVEAFKVLGTNVNEYDISVNVHGGGVTGQSEAIRLGITRALMEIDGTTRPALKKAGLVTRDPREVERKKPGKRKARRSTQFSKR
jgi:small subunit ribosomal protein S9